MKKKLLLGSALLIVISSFSQTTNKLRPNGSIDVRKLAETKYADNSNIANKNNSVKAAAQKSSKSSSSNSWQAISSSMNIYGVVVSFCKPLQWNDELDAVSFIHRKSPSYVMSPIPASNAETGGIVAMVSTNCGASWDSTAIFSNDNFWGRYPSGAIYNPALNTNINNSYIVGAGPTTGPGNVTWIGNYYASKKLGAGMYNNAPSTISNAVQIMPTASPFSANVPSRHDFTAYNFAATDDGKMRVLAGIRDDVADGDTAVMLMTGTFNNGVFEWAGKVFDPPTTIAPNDGVENWVFRPMMAWNETGNVGYVVIIGSRIGATLSESGLQPIVYKTINSGLSWTLESGINFNSPSYDKLKRKLWHVDANENLVVPNFLSLEGIDCAVDINNKLHIFTTLVGHVSTDPDSLNHISQWTSENYLWPHMEIAAGGAAIHPYLYDFVYDGTNASPAWSNILVDSMSSEGAGERSIDGGFQDNPWDGDPATNNDKIRTSARLQVGRTPDGKYIMYTWAESDTAFTDQQKKWNNLPNIKARLFRVIDNRMSDNEVDVTVLAGGEVGNRATNHFISPKFKLVSIIGDKVNVSIPMTISNSSPYAQATTNTHYYSCAGLEFTFQDVGIKENNSLNLNTSIYPNPAKNKLTVGVNLVTSSKVNVELLNGLGQVISSTQAQCQPGNNTINLEINGLTSGIYFVKVKADNASSTKKLIVE